MIKNFPSSRIARILPDPFLAGLLAAILLALAAPDIGSRKGPIPIAGIIDAGIALIFFLHGANLAPAALKAGARSWKLHVLVQSCTFGFFPLMGSLVYVFGSDFVAADMRLGFFYLCALSTTISSSVATVSMAKGNIPAAIFNVTLSTLLGMSVTPALIALVQSGGPDALPVGSMIADIALKLLLPFAVGQLLRPMLTASIARYKAWITKLDRTVILFIVYTAFCNSTAEGIWSHYPGTTLLVVAALVIGLLALVLTVATLAARALGLPKEDEVTGVFCGSQKSLANGAPIAQIIFGANPALGAILLPLMIYHPLQLVACSALARRYRRSDAAAG